MLTSSSTEADLHGTGGQRLHDVGDQTGRHDDRTVALAADGNGEPDRQLEIGAGDRELDRRRPRGADPDSTGSVPVRLVAARPAVARASARTSRSHRNFTVRPFPS